MYLISDGRYKNEEVNFSKVEKTNEIWVSMKNVYDSLGVKNMSDLALKEIYGKYERKDLADKGIRKCIMTKRDAFEKYDNLN